MRISIICTSQSRIDEFCFGEHCVISWIRYSLNGESLGIFWFLSILFVLFLPNVSSKSYHGTGKYQFYENHKGGLVSVSLIENCVVSWRRYVLKRVIPWKFILGSLYIINIMSS